MRQNSIYNFTKIYRKMLRSLTIIVSAADAALAVANSPR